MNKDRDIVLDAIQVEKDFLKQLDWFYRNECSDEIQSVIDICDRSPDGNFSKAWCNLEESELVWMFVDLFEFDLRPMLVALVLQRREEEKEHAKEMLDRMRDLHSGKA